METSTRGRRTFVDIAGAAQAGVSRRTFLKLFGAGTGSLVLAGCGSASAPASPTASSPPTSAPSSSNAAVPTTSAVVTPARSAQPKSGGTLRAAIVGDLPSIDGQQNLPGINSTVGNAYERLALYGDNLTPQPALAESWDLSTDGKQIKLSLRKGVLFHDGREFTSDDVKYSILRLRDPKISSIVGPAGLQSIWWTTLDTPDKSTIVLTSDQARPGVFDFLQGFSIVDKNTMEGPDASTKANGTGPFNFLEWVPGDHVTMLKNKNYWRNGVPLLDGITTRIFRDGQAAVVALEAGAIDELDAPNLIDLIRLKDAPNYHALVVAASGQFVQMVCNVGTPPTDNKQFRQAVNYAINRKRFVDTVFQGLISDFQDLPYPPGTPAYDASKMKVYSFDLDKAKTLLAASGVSSPEIDLTYSITQFGDINQTLAQILHSDLSSIGIKVNLKPVDFATQFDVASRRAYQGLLLSVGSGANAAEATSLLTRSRFFSPDPRTSFTGFSSDNYQSLISAASVEPDAAKRKTLYGQILDILLDESASITVSLYPQTALVRTNVHDLVYDARPALTFASAWVD
jgi:peptide/nickel transport system substrate-binding protein